MVFLGSLAANGLQYLFHFVTGRLLGPAEYGALTAILALITIVSVPFNAAGLSITKKVSLLNTKNNNSEINYILSKYTKDSIKIGLVSFAILAVLSVFFADFIHTDITSILIICASIIFLAPATIISSSLNGLNRFKASMASNLFNAGGKLVFGAVLVWMGFGLFGAVAGVTIGAVLWLAADIFFVNKRLLLKKTNLTLNIKNEIILITATLLLLNALNNIDIILARNFLAANEAGIYAAASQIGKIIFFLTSGLAIIVIPKTSEKIAQNEKASKIIFQTMAIIFLISLVPLLGVFAFPELVVNIMYGKAFTGAASVVFISCLSMTIFSATFAGVHYFIAMNKKNIIPTLLLFNIIEILLIVFNHGTALDIALDLLVAISALFLFLFAQNIISKKINEKKKIRKK